MTFTTHPPLRAPSSPTPSCDMLHTYVLALEGDKFYVGTTEQPEQRFWQHFTGQGAAWTRKYPPIEVIEFMMGDHENELTLRLMRSVGVDQVRGGIYTQIELPEHQLNTIQDHMTHDTGCCFTCRRPGHFASQCRTQQRKTSVVCYRCRRPGHTRPQCYARMDVDGDMLPSE